MITAITGIAALALFAVAAVLSLSIIVPGIARAIDVLRTGQAR